MKARLYMGIFLLICILGAISGFSQQCKLTISLHHDGVNHRITVYDDQRILSNDSVCGNTHETVIQGIKQAVKVNICLDSDFQNFNKMWLYPGNCSFSMGHSIRDLHFTDDPLNEHQQELMQLLYENLDEIDMVDSLFSLLPEEAEEHAFYADKLRVMDSMYIEKLLLSCLKHPDSYASLDVLKSLVGTPAMTDPALLRELLHTLSDKLKKTKEYQQCREVLNNPVRKYKVGDTLPALLLKTPDGLNVKLRNLLQKKTV